MKTALVALALALAFAASGCSGSNCKPDAGDDVVKCRPNNLDAGDPDAGRFDGGSVDCQPDESCVSLLTAASEKRCLKTCNPGCPEGFVCGATGVGNCISNNPDAGPLERPDDDGGKPTGGGYGCYTLFLCYPNRC